MAQKPPAEQHLWYFLDEFRQYYRQKNVGLFLKSFHEQGIKVTILTNRLLPDESREGSESIWVLPSFRIFGVTLYLPTWTLWQKYRREQPILMGYAERGHTFLFLFLKFFWGARIILKTDSCLKWLPLPSGRVTWVQYLLIRLPLRFADKILTETETAREFLIRAWHIDPIHILVLPNTVDIAAAEKNIHEPQPKQKLIVYVGRLTPAKGADMAIRAFQSIQKEWPDWQLMIIGPSDNRSYVEKLHRMADGNTHIHFMGGLSKEKLYQKLSEAAVFLLSSREEGFSNTIPEALFFRDIVVATAVGDTQWFAQAGPDVILSKPTETAVATALRQALQRFSSAGSLSNEKFARGRLNWNTYQQRFESFLTPLMFTAYSGGIMVNTRLLFEHVWAALLPHKGDRPPIDTDKHYSDPQQFWQRWGTYFDRSETQQHIYPQHWWIAERVDKLHPQSILVLGCGFGREIKFLAEHLTYQPTLTGIDFSDPLIARARKYLSGVPSVSLKASSIRELAPEMKGDLVLMHGVFMHIRPEEVADNFAVVIRSAKHFIIQCEEIRQEGDEIKETAINPFTFSHDYRKLYQAHPNIVIEEFIYGPYNLVWILAKVTS